MSIIYNTERMSSKWLYRWFPRNLLYSYLIKELIIVINSLKLNTYRSVYFTKIVCVDFEENDWNKCDKNMLSFNYSWMYECKNCFVLCLSYLGINSVKFKRIIVRFLDCGIILKFEIMLIFIEPQRTKYLTFHLG